MLFPWLTVFDFRTFAANFKKSIDIKDINRRNYDLAVLIPIFNDIKYLKNINFLKKYGEKVILCTTTSESREFIRSLRELASKYGFRISYSDVGDKKNPWAIYNKTLLAHDAVLKKAIKDIDESYVIFIDGDTVVEGDLAVLCGAAEKYNFDIASVKVLPSKRETLIEHLQGVEYDIAMQARLIYPWLTSGAGMVAKREVMVDIMRNHSLFFNGGDIEIGKLADMMGYKVGHIPMVFRTDIPDTIPGWIKQRISWMCGCFRHSVINIDKNLLHPFHFIYYSFIIFFLLPLKLFDIFTKWYILPMIIGLYIVLTFIANWKVRSRWMLVFPVYALFQILVIIWMGMYRYIKSAYKSKNIGRIKVRYDPLYDYFWEKPYVMKAYKNSFFIFLSIYLILLGSSGFFQELIIGKRYEPIEFVYMIKDTALGAINKVKPVTDEDIKEINSNTYDDLQFYKDKLKRRLTVDERISTKLRTNYTV